MTEGETVHTLSPLAPLELGAQVFVLPCGWVPPVVLRKPDPQGSPPLSTQVGMVLVSRQHAFENQQVLVPASSAGQGMG